MPQYIVLVNDLFMKSARTDFIHRPFGALALGEAGERVEDRFIRILEFFECVMLSIRLGAERCHSVLDGDFRALINKGL
jgi:hypothetical protein